MAKTSQTRLIARMSEATFFRSHLNMVTPIQILVIFYPKGFKNQNLFDRSIIDENTSFLRYVRWGAFHLRKKNGNFSWSKSGISDW